MIKTENERERALMKRVAVYLPDVVFEILESQANQEGRSVSNLASFLIETGLRQIKPMESKKSKKGE